MESYSPLAFLYSLHRRHCMSSWILPRWCLIPVLNPPASYYWFRLSAVLRMLLRLDIWFLRNAHRQTRILVVKGATELTFQRHPTSSVATYQLLDQFRRWINFLRSIPRVVTRPVSLESTLCALRSDFSPYHWEFRTNQSQSVRLVWLLFK